MNEIDKIILILKSDSDLAHELCKGQGITLQNILDRLVELNPKIIDEWYWESLRSVLSVIIDNEITEPFSIRVGESLSTFCKNMI